MHLLCLILCMFLKSYSDYMPPVTTTKLGRRISDLYISRVVKRVMLFFAADFQTSQTTPLCAAWILLICIVSPKLNNYSCPAEDCSAERNTLHFPKFIAPHSNSFAFELINGFEYPSMATRLPLSAI